LNTKRTKPPQNAGELHIAYYTMAAARRRWVWFDISPVFTDFSPQKVMKRSKQNVCKGEQTALSLQT
jgi:hypothetical protein